MALNIAAIVNDFGAYYLKSGQGRQSLYQLMRRTLQSEELFTVVLTDETIWRASKVSFDRLVQAYQPKFTPIGSSTFTPLKIEMFHQKVDTAETPHELEATWLGFLTGEGVQPKDWPFVRWWIEQLVAQIQEDIELNEIATGVRAEPTSGTPGAAGATMDGFLTIQNKLTTAGKIVPITMGAIPADDAELVQYVEDFADQIDKRYWNKNMTIACNETIERRYKRGKRLVYGKDTRGTASIDNTVENTNLIVKGYPSMAASNRLFCTPKENAITLKKRTRNEGEFDLQPDKRQVNLLSDWWRGVGYILAELVYRTDQ